MSATLAVRLQQQFKKEIRQVALSPDGTHIAVALGIGAGPEAVVVRLDGGQEVARFASQATSCGGIAWMDDHTLVAAVAEELGWSLQTWDLSGARTRTRDLPTKGYANALVNRDAHRLALVSDGVDVLDLSQPEAPTTWSVRSQHPLGCRATWDTAGGLWVSNIRGGDLVRFSADGQETDAVPGPSPAGDTETLVANHNTLFASAQTAAGSIMYDLPSKERIHDDYFEQGFRCGPHVRGPAKDTVINLSGTASILDLDLFEETGLSRLFRGVVTEVDTRETVYVIGSKEGDLVVLSLTG